MGPQVIIVGGIGAYDPTQMRFTEYNHVVEALRYSRRIEPMILST
jgi:hypothetical protein